MSDRDDMLKVARRFNLDFEEEYEAESDIISIWTKDAVINFYFDSVTGRYEKIKVQA